MYKRQQEYQRTLAGIRYQMQHEEYSNVTPFVLATDVSLKTVSTVKENNLDLPGVCLLYTSKKRAARRKESEEREN